MKKKKILQKMINFVLFFALFTFFNHLSAQNMGPADDFDGDGIINALDIDDDNDGISDTNEGLTSSANAIINGNFGTNGSSGGNLNSWTTNGTGTSTLTNWGANAGAAVSFLDGAEGLNLYQTGVVFKTASTPSYATFSVKVLSINAAGTSPVSQGWGKMDFYLQTTSGLVRIFRVTNPLTATLASPVSNIELIDPSMVINLAINGDYSSRSFANNSSYYTITVNIKTANLPNSGTVLVQRKNGAASGPNGVIGADDFSIDDISYTYPVMVDTDNDGIPNLFDLDSDGDGCPDAIEGDGNYTYMHLKNIQTVNPSYTGGNSGTGYTGTSNVPMYYNLGAVSNAQGSPIVNGVSVQQGIGDSQNGTVNYCKSSSIDTDGDGIPDSTDIDDDNDGVLDTVEQSCVDTGSPLYRDYRPGVWSGAKDALSGVNYLASTGTYVQGYQDNGTESFTFTLVDLNPGIVNTLKYRFYTLNPQNPDANNVTLSINGTTLHSFSTIAGQSNPSSLSIDMGYRTISFTPTSTTATVKIQWSTPVNGLAGSDAQFREFQINGETKFECSDIDTDNDGIVNSLDLDSDGDKCPDAVEAGSASQAGNGNTSAGILINTITDGGIQTGTVNAIVGNGTPANYGNNGFYTGIENNDTFGANYTGTYTYSNAINKNVAACSTACYRPAVTAGTVLDTKQGITSLQRAGSDNENWPMVRKGAWTALESKTKGFVPNRLTTSEIGNIPAANLKEGMMVYNKDLDCLYINTDGTPTGWKCFNTQTCP